MLKYLKYLISFLLIFGLTVNVCSIQSPANSTNYQQVSYVNTRKKISYKHSELYVYAKKILSKKVFIALITFRQQRDTYSSKTLTNLKLQKEIFQKIDSQIAQYVFLKNKTTSNNQYSSLYIA